MCNSCHENYSFGSSSKKILFSSFWDHQFLCVGFFIVEFCQNSSNVSMNRSGSKIETRSALMQLQASLAEKNAKAENTDDNDDW
jgi:hypothetical protein